MNTAIGDYYTLEYDMETGQFIKENRFRKFIEHNNELFRQKATDGRVLLGVFPDEEQRDIFLEVYKNKKDRLRLN